MVVNDPVQRPGANHLRFSGKKPAAAQAVKQTFDHPFMGDHQDSFTPPFFACSRNRLQTPVPYRKTILSTRRTKVPSSLFLFSQKKRCFLLKLGKWSFPSILPSPVPGAVNRYPWALPGPC